MFFIAMFFVLLLNKFSLASGKRDIDTQSTRDTALLALLNCQQGSMVSSNYMNNVRYAYGWLIGTGVKPDQKKGLEQFKKSVWTDKVAHGIIFSEKCCTAQKQLRLAVEAYVSSRDQLPEKFIDDNRQQYKKDFENFMACSADLQQVFLKYQLEVARCEQISSGS